jgi:hypothetical protein
MLFLSLFLITDVLQSLRVREAGLMISIEFIISRRSDLLICAESGGIEIVYGRMVVEVFMLLVSMFS